MDDDPTVKDGWGGFFFFFFLLKQYFCFYFWLAYVLWWHADKLEQAGFFSLRSGDGLFKMCRPMSQLICGCRFKMSNFDLDPSPGLEDFMILWLAANYWEGVRIGWEGGFKYWVGLLWAAQACFWDLLFITEQNYREGVQSWTSRLDRATLKIYNFVALYPNWIQAYVCCKIFTC